MQGHLTYRGTAPILMTTALKDIVKLEKAAAATGDAHDANADMILRRLKVFRFCTRVPKPSKKIRLCKRCFAQYLLEHSFEDYF